MRVVLVLAVIINILAILMLLFGLFYNFKQPKSKAVFGYMIALCIFLYILTLGLALIYGGFKGNYLYSFILFLCIISHFAIGKLVRYETLKKYTVIQIMCYGVSLITLSLNFWFSWNYNDRFWRKGNLLY